MKKFIFLFIPVTIVFFIIYFLFSNSKISINENKDKIIFTESNFYKEHYNSDELLLIDVWATWCAPCIEKFPLIEALSKKNRNLKLLTLSIDKDTIRLKKFLNDNKKYKFCDITLNNLKYRDSIYSLIKLTDNLNYKNIIKFKSIEIPYVVMIKNKKIIYQSKNGEIDFNLLQNLISKDIVKK